MPWPVSTPFRMRPNLEKLDPDAPALLLHDDLAPAYARERARVLSENLERALVGEAHHETLRTIHEFVGAALTRSAYPDRIPSQPSAARQSTIQSSTEQALGSKVDRGSAAPTPSDVARQLQEDFVILKHEGDSLRTEYLSVCFPSRWDPREKLGLDFSQIHAPVADNQMLLAAGSSIMAMAFMKQPMLRHVWLVVPSASLAQHPDQNDYSWTETLRDPAPLLPRLFFRVERQTTWPLPQFKRAVFFIRVMMSPLADVLRVAPARAHELAHALRSMSPAVVAYRGMTDAMPRLLSELDAAPR
jgi:dimethylamine monooxygenase subunit A